METVWTTSCSTKLVIAKGGAVRNVDWKVAHRIPVTRGMANWASSSERAFWRPNVMNASF